MNYRRLLFWLHRPDGSIVKPRDAVQKLMPYIMTSRNHSCIYHRLDLNLTETQNFLQECKKKNPDCRVSLFTLIIAAMIRTAHAYPRLNYFVAGRRLYARNSLEFSYVVKRDLSMAGTETLVKQRFAPGASLYEVSNSVNAAIAQIRSGGDSNSDGLMRLLLLLPGFLLTWAIALGRLLNYTGLMPGAILRADPLSTSAIIANLGSIGADAPFHHLYEWGTASLFVAIGKHRQSILPVTFSIDERIADGYYFAQAVQYFQGLVENPTKLQNPPEVPDYDQHC